MKKCICIVGTLDTKGREVEYMQKIIEQRGHETVIIDTGVIGTAYIKANYTREAVAKKAGYDLDELVRISKR